jgi:hypothetical protein
MTAREVLFAILGGAVLASLICNGATWEVHTTDREQAAYAECMADSRLPEWCDVHLDEFAKPRGEP